MLDLAVLACRRPGGWRRNCTTQTRSLGSDGWDGAMVASYGARDDVTFFMHSLPGKDTLRHPSDFSDT